MLARAGLRAPAASVRAFSTSRTASIMSKLTLVGRLGAAPQEITDKQGRSLLVYSIGTADSRQASSGGDGKKGEPTTSWHRILSYREGGRDYLKTLPAGTLVYVEADFKRRNNKNDDGTYTEQTISFLRDITVLSRPKDKAEGGQD